MRKCSLRSKSFQLNQLLQRTSREAAQECSPGRKPWVERELTKAPKGRKSGTTLY
jgi:hypothetical protein